MSLGKIIRQRREQMGLTQDHVAARAGLSKPYLSNIETGKTRNPPTDGKLAELERVLDFEGGLLRRLAHLARTPADVRLEHEQLQEQVVRLRSALQEMLEANPSPGPRHEQLAETLSAGANISAISNSVAVPIINQVAAGYPHHFTDLDYPPSVADEYIRVADLHDPQAFAARVVGDSMEPAYREGDLVVFSPSAPVDSGKDCFVRFAETCDTTFKRVYLDDERSIRLQPLNNRYPAETHPAESISGLWPAVYRIQRIR